MGGVGEAAGWHSVGRATDDGVVACEIIVRTLHLKVHAQRNFFCSVPKVSNA